MPSHENKRSKDELLWLIRESNRKGADIKGKAAQLGQWGQFMMDLAHASEEVIQYVEPSAVDWKPLKGSWTYANEQQDAVLLGMGGTGEIPAVTMSGTANAYSMTYFASSDNVVRFSQPEKQDESQSAALQLSYVIDREADKRKLLRLLKQYGLDKAGGSNKSPVQLLETAYAAFENPPGEELSAETSLLPMRECINAAIATLLRRRPQQKPAKSPRNKVLSICTQMAASGVPQQAIQSLAQRWEGLLDELSASKQNELPRGEWCNRLRRANLFLQELLQSLDQSKMKWL